MSKSATRKAPKATRTNNGAKLAAAVLNTKFFYVNPLGRTRLTGHALKAYTRAWMAHSGMTRGAAMPRAMMSKIAGDTAIRYHVKLGNFAVTESNEITITDAGKDFFGDAQGRPIEPAFVNAFYAMLASGKVDGAHLKGDVLLPL